MHGVVDRYGEVVGPFLLHRVIQVRGVLGDGEDLFGHVRERDHHVPEGLRRHVVDQVDDAVLQAAGVEAVEDVRHQRW